MSRTTRLMAGAALSVGFLVVIVRGQDNSNTEPRTFPGAEQSISSAGEPTPAKGPNPEQAADGSPSGEILRSQYEARTSSERASSPSVIKRPSAAERLQQFREPSQLPGSAVQGPVTSDPINMRGAPPDEQPSLLGDRNSSRSGKSFSVTDSQSGGGSSILKKAPTGDSNADRQTARRVLRSPSSSSKPATPPAALPPAAAPRTEVAPEQPAAIIPPRTTVEPPQAVLNSRSPALRVETHGPKALKLGTEATYTIHVQNDGDTDAHDVFVRVGVPVTAKVVAVGSAPESGVSEDAPHEQRFVWTISRLPARATETVTMRITPTDGQPIDLFVDWTIRPVSAMAQIEVQQPQIEMSVFGPKDIAYGEVAKYTIRLTNSGNGDADDVVVDFGYGQHQLEPRRIGTLAAGQQQEISLELTARQTGAMPVVAMATAAGGLRAQASQEVLVRRASLETEVLGDPRIFAGSPANYRIVIRNSGNAPASQVTAMITLPNGAQLIHGGDEARPEQGGLSWNIGVLPTNGERRLDLQCVLNAAGDNAIRVEVAGAGELASSGTLVTRVEALAELKLAVNDPQGPVAVGQDALYEIHISNRGTKAATKINVVAQFSSGIEPVEAKGAPAELVPGQVVFQAIPRIDPGQEVTLIVRARAEAAGPKRFRAEVTCEELDEQLVAQETTHFFSDSSGRIGSAKSGTIRR